MEEVTELHFSPPSRKARGFMRRMRILVKFSEKSRKNEISPSDMDEMVDFLAQYVSNPGLSHDEKVELVWDCSQEQFDTLMELVQEGSEEEPDTDTAKN